MTSPDDVGFDAVASAWEARTAAEAAQIWQVTVPEAGAWIMEFGTSNGLTGHDQDAMWSLLRSLPQVLSRVQPSQLSDQPVSVDVADASDIVGALLDVDPEHEESMLAGWRFVAENSSAESISDLATTHGMHYFDACQLVLSFGRANGMMESGPDAMWTQLQAESAERARFIDSFMNAPTVDTNVGPRAAVPSADVDTMLHDFKRYLEHAEFTDAAQTRLHRLAGRFVHWCPPDTDWSNREQLELLRSDYLRGLSGREAGRARSATRRLLDMQAGMAPTKSRRAPLVLDPWLAEYRTILRSNGYQGANLEKEIDRLRVFVRWVGQHRPETNWRSGAERLDAWDAYRGATPRGDDRRYVVRRWFNALTGSPLAQGWDAHRSPELWKDIPASSSLDKFIPPPPPAATTNSLLGVRVASLAEQQSQDPPIDAEVNEAKHWKFHSVDPTARREKRVRLE